MELPKYFCYLMFVFCQPGWILPQSSFELRTNLTVLSIDEEWNAAVTLQNSILEIFRILPEIERKLRKLYVQYNSLYIGQSVGVAAYREYYTTLDGYGQRNLHHVILSPTLFRRQDCNNMLYKVLPKGMMHLLVDLFLMPSGPKLRAFASHGDLFLYLTEFHTKAPLIACQIMLLLKALGCKNNNISPLIKDYRTIYHPKAILNSSYISCLNAKNRLQDVALPLEEDNCIKYQPLVSILSRLHVVDLSLKQIDLLKNTPKSCSCRVAILKECLNGYKKFTLKYKSQASVVYSKKAGSSQRRSFTNTRAFLHPFLLVMDTVVYWAYKDDDEVNMTSLLTFVLSFANAKNYEKANAIAIKYITSKH